MSDQSPERVRVLRYQYGLQRVLENRDPRGYFSALSTWFTEGYQRSSETVGILHNQIVRPRPADCRCMAHHVVPCEPCSQAGFSDLNPVVRPSTYQGQMVTSDTRVGTSRHQRRVQWSGEVLDNEREGTSVAEEVSSVVECCKPEWIEVGWKCYTCGRGLVARTVDPYDQPDSQSDNSDDGAYIIRCTPSGRSERGSSSSSSSTSPNTQSEYTIEVNVE